MISAHRSDHRVVLDYLSKPEAYGLGAGETVSCVETHASLVFLVGDRAYKLKKPVRFPYLDFSSLDRRLAACRDELAINRIFSPDLYLGLGAVIAEPGKGLSLIDPTEILDPNNIDLVEPLVVMRRFDDEDQLDCVAARGALDDEMADRLGIMAAETLACSEIRKDEPGRDNWAQEITAVINESLAEIDEWPALFNPGRAAVLRTHLALWLAANDGLLVARAGLGRIRRCHGDLHLQNIYCQAGRPVPFDALEFDETLAITDVLYDLAFLIMDLLHRDLPRAAARVLGIALTLSDDFSAVSLLPGYLATRAIIRAKVIASQIAQDGARADDERIDVASRYFQLACRLIHRLPPRLIAIGGLSGTGKTSCAFRLAEQFGPATLVIRSDVVRKHLEGVDLFDTAPSGAYEPGVSARVYGRMLNDARAALSGGATVILDAVFAQGDQREACRRLASELDVGFDGLWLEAPRDCRLDRATHRGPDASDAGPSVVRQQDASISGKIDWARIWAGGGRDEVVSQAAAELRSR